MAKEEKTSRRQNEVEFPNPNRPYDQWVQSLGLLVHQGYYVEDLRTLEVRWWEERECNAAIIVLAGQEGVTEVRLTEIPPGKKTAPWRIPLDEVVYVVEGGGLATVWTEGKPKINFEWQQHSLFLVPRNYDCQFTNMQGSKPARLVHYNALPLAMSLNPDPDFFFKNPYVNRDLLYGEQNRSFYSEAKAVHEPTGSEGVIAMYWSGNFFPNMQAWDKLVPYLGRGAGGHVVRIHYPNSPLWNHMSVFPAGTYKKGHRHGPGTLVVITEGEGYSFLWREGKEKIFIPWHQGSVFVPPNRWYHQHFNVGAAPARYLAFHSPRGGGSYFRDQIEYPDEDPLIRRTFESELAKKGLTSLMPLEAYGDRTFEWAYEDQE